MSFTQINFLFIFLPIFLILYRLLPARFQKPLLLVGGLVFYAWGQGLLVVCLMVSVTVNYLLHLALAKSPGKGLLLAFCMVLNAGLLVACKVTGFLPLGVSFYTFQVISLQVDLKDQEISPLDFGVMTCAFPKLVMGPMVRISDFREALAAAEARHLLTGQGLDRGLKLFTVGLGFKILLADNLATLYNSIQVAGAGGITTVIAWLGAMAYTMELYFDFFGYSLMAVGLGHMLGLPIPENFNEPYCSKTVGEFWRRWHMTLGQWFRDYVYIPMGGSRRGSFRTFDNLLLVWLLTGIWHGWGFNYFLWSMFLFVFIALEKFTPLGKLSQTKVVCHLYLIPVIIVSWTIFAIGDTDTLFTYLKVMVGIYADNAVLAPGQLNRYLRTYWYLLAAGAFFMTPIPRKIYGKLESSVLIGLPLLAILALSVYLILQGSGNVFMYYQF